MTFRLVTHDSIGRDPTQMTITDLVREPTELMDRVVKQLKQSRIPTVKVRWNSRILSSFHQYHFRDQHKLNFGTKFLLEGKNVTTRNFMSFFKRRNFIFISESTIHFYYSLLLFTFTLHFRNFLFHILVS